LELQSSIRLPGNTQGEQLSEKSVAIANDLVALVDQTADSRATIHLFDPQSGKSTGDGKVTHLTEVVELAVSQCGPMADRRVAFVDSNAECFLALINSYEANRRLSRLGSVAYSTRCLSSYYGSRRYDGA